MINFTAMSQGYQRRGDENRVERRKVAEAFEQFKRNNPEATLAQFQQYIDGMSGGRNYLAGGAGSGETLRKLAADNQAKKARRLAAEGQASLLKQYQTSQRVEEDMRKEIENSLLNAKPTKPKEGPEGRLSGVQPKINYGRLAREFAENNPLIGKMGVDLSDMFTEQTRTDALNTQTTVNLPVVQALINGMPSEQLKNLTSDDLTTMYPMAPLVADAVLNKAKGVLAEKAKTEIADLTSRAKADILQRVMSEDIDLADIPEYLKGRFGHLPLYEQAFGEASIDGFINSISGPIDRKIADRATAKEESLSEKERAIKNNIRVDLQSQSDAIVTRLKATNIDQVREQLIREMMESYIQGSMRGRFVNANEGPDGVGNVNEVRTIVTEQVDKHLETYGANHELLRQQALGQVPALARSAATEYVQANIKKGTDTFTQNAAGAMMANGNPAGQFVARQLGGGDGFVMTGDALSIINSVLQEFMVKDSKGKFSIKEGTTIADMAAAARARLTEANAPTVKQALGNQKLLIEAQNVPPPLEAFGSYLEGLSQGITETKNATLEGANEIFHSSDSNPALAINRLQQGLASYRAASNHINGMAAQHSKTSFSWVDPAGGDRYDADQVRQVLGTLDGDVEATINKMIEEISRNAAEQSRTMPSVQAPVVAEPPAGLVSPPVYSDSGAYIKALKSDDNAQVAVDNLQTVVSQDVGAAVEDFKQMGGDRYISDVGGPENAAKIEKMRADAAASEGGRAPSFDAITDPAEQLLWRNAFGMTHQSNGVRIKTLPEKFTDGVQDVKKLYETITSGTEDGPSQTERNAESEAGIAQARSDLTRQAQTFSYLDRDLQALTMLQAVYNNEALNITEPTNKQEAEDVVADLKELFKGSVADLGEDTYEVFNTRGNSEDIKLIDELIKQIMDRYQ